MKIFFLLFLLLLFFTTSVTCEAYSCQINSRKYNIKNVILASVLSFVTAYISLNIVKYAIIYFGIDDLLTILITVSIIIVLIILGLVSYLIK